MLASFRGGSSAGRESRRVGVRGGSPLASFWVVATLGLMTSRATKTVDVDEDLIERTRDAMHRSGDVADADVVELALRTYVGRQALEVSQSLSELDEAEAMRIAVQETHAMRRERRGAA